MTAGSLDSFTYMTDDGGECINQEILSYMKYGVYNIPQEKNFTAAGAGKAEEAVGSTLNRDLERKIAAAAVTVVKNEDNTLPFKVQTGDHVLLLGAFENEVPD